MAKSVGRGFIRARYAVALGLGFALSAGLMASHINGISDTVAVEDASAEVADLRAILSEVSAAAARRSAAPERIRLVGDPILTERLDALAAQKARAHEALASVDKTLSARLDADSDHSRDIAAVISIGREIAAPRRIGPDAEIIAQSMLLGVLIDNAVAPAMSLLKKDLQIMAETVRRRAQHRALGAFLILALGALATALFVFAPMERRIIAAQDTLEQETQSARNAERKSSTTLARTSHEIRTLMNGVLGVGEILARTDLNAEQRRYLGVMRASSDSLLRLLDDTLEYSKLSAGEMKFEARPFDPAEALMSVALLFAPRAQLKKLDFVVDLDPTMPKQAHGDRLRLGQMTSNLLHNALKFTEEGRIALVVDFHEDTSMLSIEVRDSGIGIPPERLGAIFEEYQQADAPMSEKERGTGLGLALVRSLATRMGGSVTAQSAKGLGSSFRILLPLGAEATAQAPAGFLNGASVLVICDDAELDRALRRQVRFWGGAPKLATDNSAAALTIADLRVADWAARAEGWVIGIGGPDECGTPPLGADALLHRPVDPVVLRSAAERPGDQPVERIGVQESARFSHAPRVLVAEDNEVNQLVARVLLTDMGCVVETVIDGRKALELATAQHFDMILMDVTMPVMNGLDATRAIRSAERRRGERRGAPVIALTAHAGEAHRAQCMAAGMDDHLPKPFTPALLFDAVRRWAPPPAQSAKASA